MHTDHDETQIAMIEAYLGQTLPRATPRVAPVTVDRCREGVLLAQALRLLQAIAADPAAQAVDSTLHAIERRTLVEALERTGGVQYSAAKLLGISSRVMCYKIKVFGIDYRKMRGPRWRVA